VIIGGGIVGNSPAYHLPDQGNDDVLLVDNGPVPDPGGFTGHISNYIMPVEHSSETTELTLEPIRQSDSRVLGAVRVSGPIRRLKGEMLTTTLPEQVMEAASVIDLNIETTTN